MSNLGEDIEHAGYAIIKVGLLLFIVVIVASCLGVVFAR